MEWNRGPAPTQPASQPAVNHAAPAARKKKFSLLSLPTASVGLLFCIAILILAIAGYVALAGANTTSNKFVDKSKMQAIFLNGGQVYFGKITSQNDKTMQVGEIYYLRVNQQVQPDGSAAQNANQNISLVKLGCELHGPQDSMVINQEQIIFWENLKDDGQVAKAVAEYKKANPGPQKCDAPAAPTSTTPAPTTPTTPTTKKP